MSGGPFRIAEVIEGRSVILERTPRYWGSSARSRRIEVLAVPDPTTAIQLLQDGRVDVVAPTLGVSWGHRLGLLPGVRWGGAFGSDLVALVANVDRLPDGSTRHAVFEAVDRSRFTEAVIRDEGRPTDAVLPPGMEDAIPAWRSFGRGPVPPFVDEELQLVYARTELLELTARYIQAEVERAGGDLELVGLESDVFWSGFMAERRFDLALVEVRGSPTPDLAVWTGPPDGIWSSLSGLPAPPEQSLEETQRDLAFAAPVLPLFELRTTMGWRDGIEGVAPNPSVEGPLWNAQEWSKPEV